MIQIHQHLTDDKINEALKIWKNDIIDLVYKKDGILKKRYQILEKVFKKKSSFVEIIKLPFNNLDKKKSKRLNALQKKKILSLYESIRKKIGFDVIGKLKLQVCPYCNRNFINNSKSNTNAQFDHFYDKNTYPILAVSFFNLVPCCYSCNHSKQNKELKISPYDNKKTTDELITFSYLPINTTDVGVILKSEVEEMKENIKTLELDEQYKIHNDLVKQIIYKAKKYPKSYLEHNSFDISLNMTKKELYYCNYLDQSKYYLRPLSKLTKDIVDEVQ